MTICWSSASSVLVLWMYAGEAVVKVAASSSAYSASKVSALDGRTSSCRLGAEDLSARARKCASSKSTAVFGHVIVSTGLSWLLPNPLPFTFVFDFTAVVVLTLVVAPAFLPSPRPKLREPWYSFKCDMKRDANSLLEGLPLLVTLDLQSSSPFSCRGFLACSTSIRYFASLRHFFNLRLSSSQSKLTILIVFILIASFTGRNLSQRRRTIVFSDKQD